MTNDPFYKALAIFTAITLVFLAVLFGTIWAVQSWPKPSPEEITAKAEAKRLEQEQMHRLLMEREQQRAAIEASKPPEVQQAEIVKEGMNDLTNTYITVEVLKYLFR